MVPVEDRWERMVAGKPYVASCTVTIDQEQVETCSGPEAVDSLTFGSLGDSGTREFFTHVRFHKHDEERIVVHLLVELYARSEQEAIDVLEEAARGTLEITSLAEESRPPAHAADEAHWAPDEQAGPTHLAASGHGVAPGRAPSGVRLVDKSSIRSTSSSAPRFRSCCLRAPSAIRSAPTRREQRWPQEP